MTVMSSQAPRPEADATPERPSGPLRPALSPALERELATASFDHPWDLAPGLVTAVADPGARQAAWTVEAVLEGPVRDAFAATPPDTPRDALILGCGEGRLGHALLAWGAARVVGLETDARRLRRAELLREHFALPFTALALRATPGFAALDATALGTFAVVVVATLPTIAGEQAAALAVARACARGPVALMIHGRERPPLEALAREAGFERLVALRPPPEAERRYVLGERLVVLTRAGTPA